LRGQREHGVGAAFADAGDARCLVAQEDGAVFGVGQLFGGVFGGLPVGVLRAALHVVDGFAREFKGHAQLDHGHDLALAGNDAFLRRFERGQVAGAHGRALRAGFGLDDVHHAAARQVAAEGAGDFFFNLRPGGAGDGGEFAVKVVHGTGSFLVE
jgi:hypothetical protein